MLPPSMVPSCKNFHVQAARPADRWRESCRQAFCPWPYLSSGARCIRQSCDLPDRAGVCTRRYPLVFQSRPLLARGTLACKKPLKWGSSEERRHLRPTRTFAVTLAPLTVARPVKIAHSLVRAVDGHNYHPQMNQFPSLTVPKRQQSTCQETYRITICESRVATGCCAKAFSVHN